MKITLLKTIVLGVACSILAVSARAQSESQNPPAATTPPLPQDATRSWSTKHLSATGRDNDGAVRASKLIGAQVNDLSGHRAGQIQDIIVNPTSGRIDFALMSLGAASPSQTANADMTGGKLVPVPWSLFRASSAAQYSSGSDQPRFTLNMDQSKLSSAPTVDWSDLNQSEWRQRIYAYYGVTPQPSSSQEDSLQNQINGESAGKKQVAPEPLPRPNP